MKKSLLLLFSLIACYSLTAQETPKDTTHANAIKTTDTSKAIVDTVDRGKLSFGPAIIDFNVAGGQSKTQTFYIVNTKKKLYKFNLSIKDFTFDSLYTFQYASANSTPTSCASWITLDKTYIEVPPNGVGKILVTMNVPDNPIADKEARWAFMNADIVSDAQTSKRKDVTIKFTTQLGVGVPIYQSPPSAIKDVRMIEFTLRNDTTLRILSKNSGQAKLECKLTIELTANDSEYKKNISKENITLLPGTTRIIELKVPADVPKGKYNAVAILDAGDDDVPLEAAQSTIEIK